jgi:hypothetical protein
LVGTSTHFGGSKKVEEKKDKEVESYLEEFTLLEIDVFRKKVVPAPADQKIFLNMLYLREYVEFFRI